jgi:hypothetical protein
MQVDFMNEFLSKGFYPKPRGIDVSPIAHTPPCAREVYDLMLRKANWKDRPWRDKVIRAGQLVTTYKDIAEHLHWTHGAAKRRYSKKQIETALRRLDRWGLIKRQKICRGLIITVCNYSTLADPKSYRKSRGAHDGGCTDATTLGSIGSNKKKRLPVSKTAPISSAGESLEALEAKLEKAKLDDDSTLKETGK